MRVPRPRLCAALAALLALALIGWMVLHMSAHATGDYNAGGQLGGDDAAPVIVAIIHGHWDALPRLQTVMGLVSILYRVPFVAVATWLGASIHVGYQVGAIACLLPIAGIVAWLAGRARTVGELGWALLAAVVMILNPASAVAVYHGHPEELFTAALTIIAVLAAQADRRTWAAVALGLCLGAKQSSVVVVPVVLIALSGGRWRVLFISGAIGAATSLPLALLDPTAFHLANENIGLITTVSPLNLWWIVGAPTGHLPFGMQRTEALAIALAVATAIVWGAGRRIPARDRAPVDVMALLALACTLRCLCDPVDLGYYLVAVVVPLAVWEAGTLRRPPVAAGLVWLVQALCLSGPIPFGATNPPLKDWVGPLGHVTGVIVFLLCALGLAAYLTRRTFVRAPGRFRPLMTRRRRPAHHSLIGSPPQAAR